MRFPVLVGTIRTMPREESHGSSFTAMGQRERRIGARSGRSSYARYDFKINSMRREVVHLFAQAAEDARIATLKAHDEPTLAHFTHKHGVNLVLRH